MAACGRDARERSNARKRGAVVDQSSMNKAAERLVEATWDTYKTLVNHTLTLQQRNAKFVQEMVDDSIEELRRQAENNRAMTRELLELAEGQREVFRELIEASVLDAYTNFLFAPFTPFSYYREEMRSVSTEVIQRGSNGSLPIENYDELSIRQISKRLEGLSEHEIRIIRYYEERHKNRETLLKQLDSKLI
jgi:hypothetical protein